VCVQFRLEKLDPFHPAAQKYDRDEFVQQSEFQPDEIEESTSARRSSTEYRRNPSLRGRELMLAPVRTEAAKARSCLARKMKSRPEQETVLEVRQLRPDGDEEYS
jgi:hypothetical protein